ncbi:hypothetical protein PBI_GRAVY_63 [Gordonia phage Gravy]|uniref:Uncharacterized protein n=2 Tax=Tanisvirus tanis TaxID=2844677 RepID=A0A2P1JYH3_9CAUD|nr:hypothetical protein PBI_GRAVY_63 [Gordonia phage Gravy]AVO25396.1 hypothetical protein PBI_KERRY_63 [Gordonia phage Kerry]WNM72533.1 hypothetical protein SEA_ARTORIAS_64 [Gordonia phage Artorias]
MGRHRRGDGEPPSPFIQGSLLRRFDESVVRHSLNDDHPDVKVVENSYSVWREPVAE